MKRKNKSSEERRKKFKLQSDNLLTGFRQDLDLNDEEPTFEPELEGNSKSWDNEEQNYELKPRSINQVIESLPIKIDGKIERQERELHLKDDDVIDGKDGKDGKQAHTLTEKQNQQDKHKQEGEEEEVFNVDENLSPSERLIKIKEEISNLATKLLEDPESNIQCLTRLRKMSMSKNFVLSQLSIISLVPIFKSLSPSYKIRSLTDAEKKEKVSKEVSRLRGFEQGLIYNYLKFINYLSKLSKISHSNSLNNKKITAESIKLGEISIKSIIELLNSSLKHFNYRNELLIILIKRLNRKPTHLEDLKIFQNIIRTLETLVVDDKENGEISNDVVTILCKIVKEKNFRIDESVLNIFLSLSILDDYDPSQADQPMKEKLKKKDRVHLSKKQKKVRKELKEIEKELEDAKQSVTAEERSKYQSNILKNLLKLYLEILKLGSQAINSNGSGGDLNDNANLLIGSVLEGLSKFGRMANFDLLGDFLEILREIMSEILDYHSLTNTDTDQDGGGIYDNKQIRLILLCIVTAFQLTLSNSSIGKLPISIDLSKFISSLYLILTDLSLDSDLEFSYKSLRLLDPLSTTTHVEKPSVNVSTKSQLLLTCLDLIFFKSKNGTTARSLSFMKRLYITTLQTPEKTSLALLKFISKMMAKYNDTKGLFNTEEIINNDGNYQLGIEYLNDVDLERSNGEAATLWENVLLDKHYNPMVRDNSRSLVKLSKK